MTERTAVPMLTTATRKGKRMRELTEFEKRLARWMQDEQDVCRAALSDEEKRAATSLARCGVLVSERKAGCRHPHYRPAFLGDLR